MKTWLLTDVLDHVCVCASASRDNTSRQSERIGGEREGCWGGLGMRMWEDWASAVSSLHSHMVQCPSGTMLNDKEPTLYIAIGRHTFTDTSVWLHPFSDMPNTTAYIYTSMHTQKHAQSTFTGRHTHPLHFASVTLFIIQSFFLGMWCAHREAACTLQTRYTLIMHAQTTGIAFWCACV